MDHTQGIDFKEFFSQLTTEEKLEAFKILTSTDVMELDEKQLAPSIPQARQLETLLRQYAYQHKMVEYELFHCTKDQVPEVQQRMAKASGIVEVLSYLLKLAPTQPESNPS